MEPAEPAPPPPAATQPHVAPTEAGAGAAAEAEALPAGTPGTLHRFDSMAKEGDDQFTLYHYNGLTNANRSG